MSGTVFRFVQESENGTRDLCLTPEPTDFEDQRMTRLLTLTLTSTFLLCAITRADDWPQWRGPNRDGKSAETGLLKKWPEKGPELAWTFKDTGGGYSGPAIVGGKIYIMGARKGGTDLIALDEKTGKELWSTQITTPAFDFKGNAWGVGPRATPTVADGMIYALAADGVLACVDLKGKIQWKKHMIKDLGGDVNPIGGGPKIVAWGYCWSPLVDGDKVICVPGGTKGTVAALDKKTGKELWRSTDLTTQATYSSPMPATIGGVKQYLIMTDSGVAGVSEKGELLWNFKKRFPYPDVVVPTPIAHDNHVYVTAGYGAGCDMIEITNKDGKFGVTPVYDNKYMKNTLGGVILLDGYVYGASERVGWLCQDFKTGKRKWNQRGAAALGDGSVVYADGLLFLYAAQGGELGLIEASPKGWSVKGRFHLPEKAKIKPPSGRNWTPPVIANGMMYVRDQELLFCYKVK